MSAHSLQIVILQRLRPYWPLGVVALATGLGLARGLGFALLALAGGALLWAISMLWLSVQSLGDETELSLEEALVMAAPSAEEEQKRAVLRALKDLEYERSVGKVSEEDYQTLTSRYREDAKRLLQALDREQNPAREKIEKLVAKRIAKTSPQTPLPGGRGDETPKGEVAAGSTASKDLDRDDAEDAPLASQKVCSECSARNDPDARFCKKCGGELE